MTSFATAATCHRLLLNLAAQQRGQLFVKLLSFADQLFGQCDLIAVSYTHLIDYAELKTRVSIHDAIQKLGLELKPAGHQLRGFCPQCKTGSDRALVITPDKSLFYCFSAKTGGDQIALCLLYTSRCV